MCMAFYFYFEAAWMNLCFYILIVFIFESIVGRQYTDYDVWYGFWLKKWKRNEFIWNLLRNCWFAIWNWKIILAENVCVFHLHTFWCSAEFMNIFLNFDFKLINETRLMSIFSVCKLIWKWKFVKIQNKNLRQFDRQVILRWFRVF